MKKIIAFGASNSRNSINKQLVKFSSSLIHGAEIELLDLNDFEMPIYSIDREKENGIPDLALQFKEKIKESSAIMISLAEHNGSYTVAFKNIYDWVSRIERDIWLSKPMFVMATSPGGRGGRSVLELAVDRFTRDKAEIIAKFSLPSFMKNFSREAGILDDSLKVEFDQAIAKFQSHLDQN